MKCCGQSLVEFALVAPILIVLAMSAWDGGSALREQVVLQQAARDGARVAATAFGGTSTSIVQDAVVASAADLPTLTSTPGFLNVTSNAQSVTVRVQYAHALITPVLRQLWGGGQGTLTLSASSTFYVPQQTPVPATIVPSTPIPTPVPTPTITTCTLQISVPPLANNANYTVTVQLKTQSSIKATWDTNGDKENIALTIYSGSTALASSSGNTMYLSTTTPQTNLTGTFTVEFHKEGVGLTAYTNGTIVYQSATCP